MYRIVLRFMSKVGADLRPSTIDASRKKPAILSVTGLHGQLCCQSVQSMSSSFSECRPYVNGRCKRVTHCLIAFFLCTLGAWIILDVMITKGTSSMPGGEVFTGCLFMAPDYFYAAWIPPVVFETVIIVLTVYKISQADSMTPTLTILARDSIVYFTMIFVMLLSNLFLARFGKGFQGALLIEPCSVVACIAVARMTLNIRDSKQTIPVVSGGPRTTELHFEADVSELTVGTNLSSV
ncbi:hypothetical protein H2248_003782 [Termitomyces sp. 'cryptogamus']|nr:hypothetical protein H2248_003782 [Termitomyces sp. 'cryptogamus']